MRKIKLSIFFLYLGTSVLSQNVYDAEHLLQFANHLYKNKEYEIAINEYKHALFLGNCNPSCQVKLFNSCLLTRQYNAGINTYKSIYPEGLAGQDTLEILYGKMLILSENYSEVSRLIHSSYALSEDQRFFLSITCDLFAENWSDAIQQDRELSENLQYDYYKPVIGKIEETKYKKPFVSLLLSTVVPGSGKMYAGYWYDGLISLSIVGITAWQAYRGFTIYGTDRPYSWIFAMLSVSFYISDLYGSFKAANMKNYNIRQNIHNEIEEVFNSVYNY
jgi:TM2 domain-containing membrane protein YozV